MTHISTFPAFTARLRDFMRQTATSRLETINRPHADPSPSPPLGKSWSIFGNSVSPRMGKGAAELSFTELAISLFSLQFTHNPAYRRFCESRKISPQSINDWREIPAVPAAAFKELELTSLPPEQRATTFHSSGTTAQTPSRHFHSRDSLAIYEASLLAWFQPHFPNAPATDFLILTPPPEQAPHSSLIHMAATLRRELGPARSIFAGKIQTDGAWELDLPESINALRAAANSSHALTLFGAAFNFVHLLDHLAETNQKFQLPSGSCVLETGGYKSRSRALPKSELHALLTERLAVPASHIVCEYGMSELSSQAYDTVISHIDRSPANAPPSHNSGSTDDDEKTPAEPTPDVVSASPWVEGRGENSPKNSRIEPLNRPHADSSPSPPLGERAGERWPFSITPVHGEGEMRHHPQFSPMGERANLPQRIFHFPPWARAQIISPETGREVAEGETGLIRLFDLANVYSVMAIQTEDLGVRRGDGFELLGRATLAESRGCSLMSI